MRRLILAALPLLLLHPVDPLPAPDIPDPPRVGTYSPPTTLPPIPDLPLLVLDPTPPITTVPSLCAALRGTYSLQVFRWCPTIRVAFNHYGHNPSEADLRWALRTIRCESNGQPDVVNEKERRQGVAYWKLASGLMQHLGRLWAPRAVAAGFPNADIFDPTMNIYVGVWLYIRDGGRHWACSR